MVGRKGRGNGRVGGSGGRVDLSVIVAFSIRLRKLSVNFPLPCAANHIAAIVGTVHYDSEGGCYNSATLIGPDGQVVGRQHKLQLVPSDEPWSQPGNMLQVFWAGRCY